MRVFGIPNLKIRIHFQKVFKKFKNKISNFKKNYQA